MAESIIKFLLRLKELGIKLSLNDDKLQASALDGVITKDIGEEIAENKHQIISFLKKSTNKIKEIEQINHDEENRYEPFPLTDVQQAYWIGRSQEFELGNVATHMYMEFEQEELDISRLENAWNKLIKRHDMLRAVVNTNGMQQVLENVPEYKMEIMELRDCAPSYIDEELMKCRDEMSHQVMPADKWPLFDVRVSIRDNEVYRIHMSIDLLIADALSWQILFKELGQLYLNPDVDLSSIGVTFRDFVYAEIDMKKTDLYKSSNEYWMERIENLAPAPDLPLVKNPSSVETPQFVRRQSILKKKLWENLMEYSQKQGLTASVVLMEAFSQVLSHWSKSPRFTINLTLFNRLPVHDDINSVIGDFTSLTLLEINNSYKESFMELTRKLQNQLWRDLDNRYVGGVHVMRELNNLRGGNNTPVMPVVFTSDLAYVQEDMMKEIYGISQTPQVWLDHQVIEQNGDLILNWDSVDELFPEGMLNDMFEAYNMILTNLSENESTWNLTMDELLSKTINTKVGGKFEYIQQEQREETLNQLFNKMVDIQPENIAVVSKDKILTYKELSLITNKIGNWLRGNNVNLLVGIIMEKGWEQVAASMGVLQGGFAYLPISTELPEDRINYLIKNGNVTTVLTQSRVMDKIKLPKEVTLLCVDKVKELGDIPDSPVQVDQKPEDTAYVIYTSGSTGEPKGVVINHKGAVNTIKDINNRYNITNNDKVLALSELNFDLSVYDVFGMLAAGGTIIMPDQERKKDPGHWLDVIKEEEVTVWNSVPALMEMLVEYMNGGKEKLPDFFRLALLSGDWISLELPKKLRELASNIDIISLGGATEASIWSICYDIKEIDSEWKSIPYGKALSNQTVYILDEALNVRSNWVSGQIYIGGDGLAVSYWNDEKMTNAKFIINPKTGERLYCTGDIGRYLPDGNIEFLGREDCQVKIQGHRIEIGEIESVLNSHPIVKNCVINVFEDNSKRKLAAYIVKEQTFDKYKISEENKEEHYLKYLVQDPVERLKFKLMHKNYRKLDKERKIDLNDEKLNNNIRKLALERRSYRNYRTETINKKDFFSLLSYFQHVKFDELPNVKSVYASAGSLYPVQLYLYVKKDSIEGVEGGTYYYHPGENSLYLIAKDVAITGLTFPPGNREIFDKSAFAIFMVGDNNAIEPLYGDWSKNFMTFESGIISHMFEVQGPQYNIGLCQIGDYDFDKIAHWFSLSEDHSYMHCLLGGKISEEDKELNSLINDSQDVIDMAKNINLEELEDYDLLTMDMSLDGTLQEGETLITKEIEVIDEILTEDIKTFLYSKLPEYMIPSAFIEIEEVHLSANGKIDRKSLPSPITLLSRTKKEYVAPTTNLEKEITEIWREVLEIDKIGIHDNIFELGGNSIDIVKIFNLLKERCYELVIETNFKIKEFFRYSTIYDISKYFEEETGNESGLENVNLIEEDINYKIPKVSDQIEVVNTSKEQTNFFLTGATGYLGAHILYELITQTTGSIYCLVRANAKKEGLNRLVSHMSNLKLWSEEFVERIHIVCGDLDIPKFGLKDEYEELARGIDSIIHCGGWVNFVYPYEALRKTNVESVKEVINLASEYKIKPINYISSLTAFPLVGKYDGEPYYENENFDDYDMLVNGYSQTKWAGERILEEARKSHIPVNIYRPAFMLGNSITGTSNKKDLVWALIKGAVQLGNYTDLGEVQLVTVDYVSKFIVNVILQPNLHNQNYNLISPEMTHFNYIFDFLNYIGYGIEESYPDEWIEQIQFLDNGNALSTFLPLLTSITDSEKDYAFGFISYDNTNARNAIHNTAIESALIDDSILKQCVEYLVDIGYFKEA